MTPGDIPCNAECRATWCRWCAFGVCTDNAPCERRIRVAAEEDREDNLDEGEG